MTKFSSSAMSIKAASVQPATTKFDFSAPKPPGPPEPSYDYQSLYGDDGDNHLDGGTGQNYITAGGGNDYLFSGNNNGTWRGSGNEFTYGATTLDGGYGDDTMQVWADTGAFKIVTGAGVDHVLISNDADYVLIDNSADFGTDAKGDVFEFNTGFSGHAVITSFEANDLLKFNGLYSDAKYGDWDETTNGATTTFHNDQTGGTIEVQHGLGVNVREIFVDNLDPSAQFPLGGFMIGGELF